MADFAKARLMPVAFCSDVFTMAVICLTAAETVFFA
jgi:hypothetical protein